MNALTAESATHTATDRSDARITAVAACSICIPLDAPVAFSTRKVSERYYTLVRVTCSDGSSGIGLCHGGTRTAELATTAVRDLIRPIIVGEDPHRTEGLWAEVYQDSLLNGRTGAVMRALSAVDIALWDRNARACGLPLHRYLGGHAKETVPAYASGGYYLPGRGADWVEEEIRQHMDKGFTAVKMKIGGASPSADLERVRVARETLGTDGILLIDANNAWRDLGSAMRHLEPMMAYHPFFIEEPFAPDDYANHARLAARLPVPIATGEILGGRFAVAPLIEQGGVTVVQSDVAVCGGVTEWRRIAGMAAGMGISMAPHSLDDLHIHLVASTPHALFVEHFPGDSIMPLRKVFDRRLAVRDGALVLPDGPGLGWNFDEQQVATYTRDGWS